MGPDRAAASSDRQQQFAKQMATDFKAWLLRNIVWSVIETDAQLECLCDGRAIAGEAAAIRERRQGEDVEYLGKIEGIEMALDWLAQERAMELVALACAECLADGEQWASNARFDDEHVEAA